MNDWYGIIHTSTRFRKSILKNIQMISLGNLIRFEKSTKIGRLNKTVWQKVDILFDICKWFFTLLFYNIDNFWYYMKIIFLIQCSLSTIVICWHIFVFNIYSSRTFIPKQNILGNQPLKTFISFVYKSFLFSTYLHDDYIKEENEVNLHNYVKMRN